MAKKTYYVWYEIVNLETRKTEKRILQTGLDYKTALAVKRDHEKICSMHVTPEAS